MPFWPSVRSVPGLIAVFLGCWLSTTELHAAPPSASVQEARRRFEEGIAAYDAGKYEAARVAFAQAYALQPAAVLLINLGHAELKLGRHVEGSRNIAKALRDAEIDRGQRRAAESALETAAPHVARVKVVVNTDDATVFIDGEDVGTSPITYTWYLEPGEHRIRASKEGFRPDERQLDIPRGRLETIELKLARETSVTSKPATSFAMPTEASPPGFDSGVSEDTGGERSLVPLFVGGGLGVVGIAAGVFFTLDAGAKREDRDSRLDELQGSASANTCGQNTGNTAACAEVKNLDDKALTSQTIGIVGFAAGGAAVLGGIVVYFLLPPETAQTAQVSLTPVLSAEAAGLSLSGSF